MQYNWNCNSTSLNLANCKSIFDAEEQERSSLCYSARPSHSGQHMLHREDLKCRIHQCNCFRSCSVCRTCKQPLIQFSQSPTGPLLESVNASKLDNTSLKQFTDSSYDCHINKWEYACLKGNELQRQEDRFCWSSGYPIC